MRMELVLHAYMNADRRKAMYLSLSPSDIAVAGTPGYLIRGDPCFFLRYETTKTKAQVINEGRYRHMKIIKDNVFYDYVADKAFATMDEWLQDCGATINDVLFGYNRFDMAHTTWITYAKLIEILQAKTTDALMFRQLETKMATMNLGFNRLYVFGRDETMIRASALIAE